MKRKGFGDLEFRIGNVSGGRMLGDWYIDISDIVALIEKGIYGPFDNKGIPMVDYDKWFKNIPEERTGRYGTHYTPVTIAHYALGNLWLHNKKGNSDRIKTFLKMADWFVNNAKERKDFIVWEHTWYEPHYKLKPPWVSAMAQGEGISALLRAYQLTGKEEYFSVSERALKSFEYNIEDGGVRSVDEKDNIWFEEYPSNPPSYVLNGFIFALFGLYDYYRISGDKKVFGLWTNAIRTLEGRLHLYNIWNWSRYDLLSGRPASLLYHKIHISQLRILNLITGSAVISEFMNKWQNSEKSVFFRTNIRVRSKILSVLEGINIAKK